MTATNGMLDPDDSVILLIDHQSGLFNTVRDLSVPDLRNYVIAIAKTATLLNIPVITTASVPDDPNGPLIPEIHHFAPMRFMFLVLGKLIHGIIHALLMKLRKQAEKL